MVCVPWVCLLLCLLLGTRADFHPSTQQVTQVSGGRQVEWNSGDRPGRQVSHTPPPPPLPPPPPPHAAVTAAPNTTISVRAFHHLKEGAGRTRRSPSRFPQGRPVTPTNQRFGRQKQSSFRTLPPQTRSFRPHARLGLRKERKHKLKSSSRPAVLRDAARAMYMIRGTPDTERGGLQKAPRLSSSSVRASDQGHTFRHNSDFSRAAKESEAALRSRASRHTNFSTPDTIVKDGRIFHRHNGREENERVSRGQSRRRHVRVRDQQGFYDEIPQRDAYGSGLNGGYNGGLTGRNGGGSYFTAEALNSGGQSHTRVEGNVHGVDGSAMTLNGGHLTQSGVTLGENSSSKAQITDHRGADDPILASTVGASQQSGAADARARIPDAATTHAHIEFSPDSTDETYPGEHGAASAVATPNGGSTLATLGGQTEHGSYLGTAHSSTLQAQAFPAHQAEVREVLRDNTAQEQNGRDTHEMVTSDMVSSIMETVHQPQMLPEVAALHPPTQHLTQKGAGLTPAKEGLVGGSGVPPWESEITQVSQRQYEEQEGGGRKVASQASGQVGVATYFQGELGRPPNGNDLPGSTSEDYRYDPATYYDFDYSTDYDKNIFSVEPLNLDLDHLYPTHTPGLPLPQSDLTSHQPVLFHQLQTTTPDKPPQPSQPGEPYHIPTSDHSHTPDQPHTPDFSQTPDQPYTPAYTHSLDLSRLPYNGTILNHTQDQQLNLDQPHTPDFFQTPDQPYTPGYTHSLDQSQLLPNGTILNHTQDQQLDLDQPHTPAQPYTSEPSPDHVVPDYSRTPEHIPDYSQTLDHIPDYSQFPDSSYTAKQPHTPGYSQIPYQPHIPDYPDYSQAPDGIPGYSQNYDYIPDYSQTPDDIPDYSQPRDRIPDYSQTPDDIPDYSQPRDRIPDYSQTQDGIPDYSQPQDRIPDYSQTPDHIPDYSQTPDHIPDYSQTPDRIPDYSQTLDHIPDYSQTPDRIPDYSQTPDRIPDYSQTPDRIPHYSQTPDRIPDYSQTPDRIPDYSQTPDRISDYSQPRDRIPDSHTPDHSQPSDRIPDYSQTPDSIQDYSQTSDGIPDHSDAPDRIPDHPQIPDLTSDLPKTEDSILDSSQTPDHIPDYSQTPDRIPDYSKTPDGIPDYSQTPDRIPDYSQTTDGIPGYPQTSHHIPDHSRTPQPHLPDSSHIPDQQGQYQPQHHTPGQPSIPHSFPSQQPRAPDSFPVPDHHTPIQPPVPDQPTRPYQQTGQTLSSRPSPMGAGAGDRGRDRTVQTTPMPMGVPLVPGLPGSTQILPNGDDGPVLNVITMGSDPSMKMALMKQQPAVFVQAGEKIPGAPGYSIPEGFRGRVILGQGMPVDGSSRRTVNGFNTHMRFSPQSPASDTVFASVTGAQASQHLTSEGGVPGMHVTMGRSSGRHPHHQVPEQHSFSAATHHTGERGPVGRSDQQYGTDHHLWTSRQPDHTRPSHSGQSSSRHNGRSRTSTSSSHRRTSQQKSWNGRQGSQRRKCGYFTITCMVMIQNTGPKRQCQPSYKTRDCCC